MQPKNCLEVAFPSPPQVCARVKIWQQLFLGCFTYMVWVSPARLSRIAIFSGLYVPKYVRKYLSTCVSIYTFINIYTLVVAYQWPLFVSHTFYILTRYQRGGVLCLSFCVTSPQVLCGFNIFKITLHYILLHLHFLRHIFKSAIVKTQRYQGLIPLEYIATSWWDIDLLRCNHFNFEMSERRENEHLINYSILSKHSKKIENSKIYMKTNLERKICNEIRENILKIDWETSHDFPPIWAEEKCSKVIFLHYSRKLICKYLRPSSYVSVFHASCHVSSRCVRM